MGERKNQRQFEDIKSNLSLMEKTVTANVIESIDPKLSAFKSEMSSDMRSEMRKLLKEEMEQTYKLENKNKSEEPASSEKKEDSSVPSPELINLGASTSAAVNEGVPE